MQGQVSGLVVQLLDRPLHCRKFRWRRADMHHCRKLAVDKEAHLYAFNNGTQCQNLKIECLEHEASPNSSHTEEKEEAHFQLRTHYLRDLCNADSSDMLMEDFSNSCGNQKTDI